MRIRLLPAILIALCLLLAAACSGSGGEDAASNQPDTADGTGDELVLNAIEALGRSADDFQTDVTSLQGRMSMEMTIGEMPFGFGGDFAFQSPDRMQMTMEFSGGDDTLFDLTQFGSMKVLVIGEDIYIKMAFLGDSWVKASFEDLGVDADQFREMLADQSPFDYSALVDGLGDDVQVQDLGPEDLEGRAVHHYRFASDYGTLMEALSSFGGGFSDGGFPVDDISGPVVLDLWLGTDDLLPYKLAAKGAFVVDDIAAVGLGGNTAFNMTIAIEDYNADIDFPQPPADAIDISEIGEDMLGVSDE